MAASIQTSALSKQYAGTQSKALDALTIRIEAGQVYGFLGSNGAGKSTTIRLLLNFLQPTSGSATICGLDVVKDSVQAKRHVGYLAGDVALYNNMSGTEFFSYMQSLQPLKHAGYFKQLVRVFDAETSKPIHTLSKGNRQKIGIIQALMHEPEALILDEPTSGLDPLMQEVFYDAIGTAKARGAAVFVSSHNLSEVQRMCDRVGIIRAGKLLREELVSDMGDSSIQQFEIQFAHHVPADLAKVAGVKLESSRQQTATVSVADDISPLLAFLAKHSVVRLISIQSDVEQEFLQLYEGES